jgi:hypothetical protein
LRVHFIRVFTESGNPGNHGSAGVDPCFSGISLTFPGDLPRSFTEFDESTAPKPIAVKSNDFYPRLGLDLKMKIKLIFIKIFY